MKIINKLLLLIFFVFISTVRFAFGQSDAEMNQKIQSLEAKISKLKSELSDADKKKYYPAISDVENRKNVLKSTLQVPMDKREKNWQKNWEENYVKADEKIDKIKLK